MEDVLPYFLVIEVDYLRVQILIVIVSDVVKCWLGNTMVPAKDPLNGTLKHS